MSALLPCFFSILVTVDFENVSPVLGEIKGVFFKKNLHQIDEKS